MHSKSIRSVQSSFVNEFLKIILIKKFPYQISNPIEEYRCQLHRNKTLVDEILPGAGNRKTKNIKSISSLAKSSCKPKSQAVILANISQFLESKNILELGTSFGISTSYIAASNPKSTILSIDASDIVSQFSQSHFQKNGYSNVHFRKGFFDEEIEKLNTPTNGWDIVFIDGNHTYNATIKYFNFFKNKLSEKGILVFDDIYWSEEMKKAWKEISSHSETSLCIDMFVMGIVWISKDFKKENFRIRTRAIF